MKHNDVRNCLNSHFVVLIRRLLRKAGYFSTGPGWALHFNAYGTGLSPDAVIQLSAARAAVKDVLPDAVDGAHVLKEVRYSVLNAESNWLLAVYDANKGSSVGGREQDV